MPDQTAEQANIDLVVDALVKEFDQEGATTAEMGVVILAHNVAERCLAALRTAGYPLGETSTASEYGTEKPDGIVPHPLRGNAQWIRQIAIDRGPWTPVPSTDEQTAETEKGNG